MQQLLAAAVLLSAASVPAYADTVVVLPFMSAGAAVSQANLDWIGESVAETIREALGSRGILTLERGDVQEGYRRLGLPERSPLSEASVLKVGETLDAEQVVYGTFEFTPASTEAGADAGIETRGSLRISARVADLKRLRGAPEFVESGALEDLATMEAHLAWRTLTLLAPNLAPPESDFRTLRASLRLDAEENYVRGLLANDPEQKEKYFIQAARLDTRFAQPCYQLGQIYYQRKEYREAADWLEKVGPEGMHYREASFLLGLARFQSGDYSGAQMAFETVAATVPLSEVYNDLGAAESRQNLPRAIENFRKALAGDGNDPMYHFNLGYALWKKGEFAAAAERFRSVLKRDPDDSMATLLLGRCLGKQGPRAANARLLTLERLKTNYEERAYWQLKSLLQPKAP